MFNKQLAALSLATTILACTAVNAYAEENYTLLTSAAPDSFAGTLGIESNSFALSSDNGYQFVTIDVQKWQETKEICYNDMKIKGNLGKITNLSNFADEDRFFMLFESASDGSTIRHVMKYDASEKTASLIETRNEWCNVTKDGYIISCAWDAFMTGTEKTEIVITDPSSNSKTVTFEYPFAPTNTFTGANITFAYDNSEYVAIVTYSPTHDFIEYTGNDFDIYEPIYVGIDRLGQTHIIDEFSNMFAEKSEYIASEGYSCISFGTIVSDNAVLISANTACYDFDMKLFCTDNGKIYDLNKSVEYPDVGQLAKISNIYDGKFIGGFTAPKSGDTVYALVDAENNKIISEYYDSISTNDGNIFTVYSSDGTAGYIDSDGNVIAMFDDVADFVGEYAMAVNNGKAFLIDRSMERVSDEIDADYVHAAGEELFCYEANEEVYFITYITENEEPAVDEPVTDEPTEEAPITNESTEEQPIINETTEEPVINETTEDEPVAEETVEDRPADDTPAVDTEAPTDTDKGGSPDTGANGIAAAAALSIVALGAVMLSRKNR